MLRITPWVLSLALAASAAGASPEEAARLKAAADSAFDNREYARALEQYRAALEQGADPRIHYNVAQTLAALERYPEALTAYQRFISEAPAGTLNPAQRERFFALLDEIKGKITRLEVRCPVRGARVLVRGVTVGTTPIEGAVSLNAGPAKVEVIAEGFKPYASSVTLVGGGTQSLDVPLERADFTGSLSVKSSVPSAHVFIDGVDRGVAPVTIRVDRGAHVVATKAQGYEEQSKNVSMEPGGRMELTFFLLRSPDYTLAYVGFGIGGAAIAVGATTGILAYGSLSDAKTQCDEVNKTCGPTGQAAMKTTKTYGVLSTVFFAGGALATGVGVYGLFTARGGKESARPVEVVALPGGIGVQGVF